MSVGFALDALSGASAEGVEKAVGPRGGDLDGSFHPERRRAHFNGNTEAQLHRFDRGDTAVPGLKNEQPWHRMAAFMLLAGRTNSEIAMSAGVTVAEVSFLRSQQWFQDLMAVLANETGQDIVGALHSHVHDAINRIAEIASGDIEVYGARTILSANLSLLEHANGKPTQKIVSAVSHSHASPTEEYAELTAELEALRKRNNTVEPT